jgi:hypothetical protein
VPRTLHPSAPSVHLSDAADALDLVEQVVDRPLRPETLVVLADDAHWAHTCFAVSGTAVPDDVTDIASLVVELAEREPAIHAVLIASVRPARVDGSTRTDLDRGLELLELCEAAGLELLDWFVVSPDGASSLREASGLPLLWRGGADGSACRAGAALRRRQPQPGGPQPP